MVLLLELARGLAALWVFFFHVKVIFISTSPIIFNISSYGRLGVPMFFVISGYVITYSAESSLKKGKSPLVFLKNRFLRIYPTFWASVVIVLILPYVIESISFLKSGVYTEPESLVTKFTYIEWSNFLILSKVFWATSHNLQAEFNAINSVYWTLAIEFQFYVVVFLALCFGKYYKYLVTAVSFIALLILFIPININYGLFIHYWPSFSIGIALAYLHRNGVWFLPRLKNSFILLVFFLIAIILLSNTDLLEINKNIKTFFFAISFGVFLWVISNIEKVLVNIKNTNNKIVYWLLEPWLILGAMSYSVYLLHAKVYQLPTMFLRQILDSNNLLFSILTIVLTLIICYPFYYFIESRFLSKNYKGIHKIVLTKTRTRIK